MRAGGDLGALAVMEREGVKSRWSREPDAQAIFHAAFAEPTASDMATVAGAYDFSRCHVVADLGGAGGGLLSAILAAHPEARGILVDRKEAIDGAARRLAAAGLADRCDLVAGDLLEAVPGGADAYIMKSVLHGYDDASARRILTNCFTSMTAESRLLLMEVVLPVQIARGSVEVLLDECTRWRRYNFIPHSSAVHDASMGLIPAQRRCLRSVCKSRNGL